LADYASSYDNFTAAGAEVVAISVDPPERSATMRDDLAIRFPLLSDATRKTITEWNLLNRGEKGGIAHPATFVIDPGLRVRFSSAEEMSRRVLAADMLALIRAPEINALPAKPPLRSINPGLMFVRAISNAFRNGVRVKRD
jgi:peroxiredoxin